jgi:uncharacterized protein
MVTMQTINDFLAVKELAIAGVSRNRKKFGGMVFHELKEKGYTLYPVNPNADKIDETNCYKSVSDLPSTAKNLYIVTPKANTATILTDAIARGIRNVWIQQQSETPEALRIAKENNINLIHGECIIMYIAPSNSLHNFHRFLRKLFGGMPK